MGKLRYVMMIHPDDVQGYTATFPALPGCVTEADTPEELKANAEDAVYLYLSALRADGTEIPGGIEEVNFSISEGIEEGKIEVLEVSDDPEIWDEGVIVAGPGNRATG